MIKYGSLDTSDACSEGGVYHETRFISPPQRISTDNCELCIILEQYDMKLRPRGLILIQS